MMIWEDDIAIEREVLYKVDIYVMINIPMNEISELVLRRSISLFISGIVVLISDYRLVCNISLRILIFVL